MRMPKQMWESLNHWGISLEVIKTALAAGLSWDLAVRLFGSAKPYFAPLAAILTVQATIAESLSRGLQRIVGVLAGIVLAMLFSHWVGINDWSLALLVFVAMALATRLKLGPQGIPQVAISALLVMAIGEEAPGYAWNRAVDTVLGEVVAIIVATVVWPRDLTPSASASLRALALTLHDLLNRTQHDLFEGLEPAQAQRRLSEARAIDAAIVQAQRAVDLAEKSLRFNPWRRDPRNLQCLHRTLEVLDHCAIQIRGIARTLFVTLQHHQADGSSQLPRPLAILLGNALALMGEAVKIYGEWALGGSTQSAAHLQDLLQQARQQRLCLQREALRLLPAEGLGFVDLSAILADLEKMSQDLN
ncbi:MAG: FUSC family protein [Sulfobacillus acidophilus]|uniref:FUSC family protein n=1 Tax=Sulfobacillus acidophilus TaxID=53633 RepID=A0A2T2WG55_9FIRM|nr:MAG: FUSC family protein [Sulfobacillus acidophilus]